MRKKDKTELGIVLPNQIAMAFSSYSHKLTKLFNSSFYPEWKTSWLMNINHYHMNDVILWPFFFLCYQTSSSWPRSQLLHLYPPFVLVLAIYLSNCAKSCMEVDTFPSNLVCQQLCKFVDIPIHCSHVNTHFHLAINHIQSQSIGFIREGAHPTGGNPKTITTPIFFAFGLKCILQRN